MALICFYILLIQVIVSYAVNLPVVGGILGTDRSARIIGSPADITDYPSQISLQAFGSHICGGSIISPTTVVTAAHCTDSAQYQDLSIRAGSLGAGSGGVTRNVSGVLTNPDYGNSTSNLAIVMLADALEYDATIQPIGLADSSVNLPYGTSMTATGWNLFNVAGSSTNSLQEVQVFRRSNLLCPLSDPFQDLICAGPSYLETMNGSGSISRDSCYGESGGALLYNQTLVGVSDSGFGCIYPYTGTFIEVSAHRDWIDGVLKENS